MAYFTLQASKGLISGIKVGSNEDVRPDDLVAAEAWAQAQIEEYLGKSWDDSSPALVPTSLAEIAHQLGAAYVLRIAHHANPDGQEVAEKLESAAKAELQDIRQGKKGIKLPNGTWDPDYRGSWNQDEGSGGGMRILCT